MPNIYSNDGELGFDFEGIFITYPYVSECTRFPVDPVKYYGLTEDQLQEFPNDWPDPMTYRGDSVPPIFLGADPTSSRPDQLP